MWGLSWLVRLEFIELENGGKYIQICNCIKNWNSESFTEFCLMLGESNSGKDLLSWVCDHYQIVYQAYLDLRK